MKVIDEGDTTLYEYNSNNNKTNYFSKTPHENVELLIFKEYNIDQNTLKENNQYKQQLSSQLILDQLKKSDFLELKYTAKKLSALFNTFNQHNTSGENKNYSKKQNQQSVYLKPVLGINSTSIDFKSGENQKTNISRFVLIIGVECEYLLPFNQRKWAFFTTLNYQKIAIEEKVTYENIFLTNVNGNQLLGSKGIYPY